MAGMNQLGVHQQWRVRGHDAAAARRLCERLGVHRLVGGLLVQRGVTDSSDARRFMHPRLTDLHDPSGLPGAVGAARRMEEAVREGEPIVVYGDYDVDGITAAAILWHVLKLAGGKVTTYVPHRIEEGYGLNDEAVRQLAKDRPLIVSVDCGITAVEPANTARALGIDLIITDHHEYALSEQGLPVAHTVVHPRLPGSGYPFGQLCGAGVAFKLAWQFAREHCGSDRLPEEFRGLMMDLLALAALGTITDVVPLVGENRVIATFGLGRIKQTGFAGLNALIEAARLSDERIDTFHVGFVLGPRLNACGRMGHARQAVELLTSAAAEEARRIATFLTEENDRRRAVEKSIFEEAHEKVIRRGYDDPECRAIVLEGEGWHPGVLGIVASRLVESFHRPVVLLSCQDGVAHGSARSVEKVSIFEALQACGHLLSSFGGHRMAAGMKLPCENIEPLRCALIAVMNDVLSVEDLRSVLEIDAECVAGEVDLALCQEVQRLGPFGAQHPAPVFCLRDVVVHQYPQRIGANGQHLRLILRQGQGVLPAIGFGKGLWADELAAGVAVDVAFEPRVNIWQQRGRAEIQIVDLRTAG